MPPILRTVERRISRGLSIVAEAAAWMMLIMIAVIMIDVVARKIPAVQGFISDTWLINYIASVKLQEWEWHLHTVVFALGLGAAYLADAHVRVDLWRDKRSERTKAWVEIFGIIVFFIPYAAVLLFYATEFAWISHIQNEGSNAYTGLGNRWIIKSVLALGILCLLLSAVAGLIRSIGVLVDGNAGARKAPPPPLSIDQ